MNAIAERVSRRDSRTQRRPFAQLCKSSTPFADQTNHLRRLGSSLSNAIRLQPGASQDARRPEDLAGRCPDDLNGALRVRTLSELLDLEAEVRFAAPRLKLFTVFLCNLTRKYSEI